MPSPTGRPAGRRLERRFAAAAREALAPCIQTVALHIAGGLLHPHQSVPAGTAAARSAPARRLRAHCCSQPPPGQVIWAQGVIRLQPGAQGCMKRSAEGLRPLLVLLRAGPLAARRQAAPLDTPPGAADAAACSMQHFRMSGEAQLTAFSTPILSRRLLCSNHVRSATAASVLICTSQSQ